MGRAIGLLVLATTGWAVPAVGDPPPSAQSATERYRGVPVRDVLLAYEGETMPEATSDLVDIEPGDVYSPEAVRRSIRQLFALGAFSDIKVEAERVGEQVDVRFRLFPRLEVRGVELSGLDARLDRLHDRLIEESRVSAGDPLDVEALAEGAERIQSILREEGYVWASVEPEASFQSPSAVVVFHVEPGRQAQIGTMQIEGVAPHVALHIRRELDVAEGSLYSRAEIDEGLDELSASWHELGYYGATVAVEATPDPRTDVALVNLEIDVDMGPRVQIEVEGADFPGDTVEDLVPIYRESLLTEDLIEESRGNLETYLRERGYRDAYVTVERDTASEGRYLYLRFRAVPGLEYEVVAIEIEGLGSVPESELRPIFVTRTRRRFRSAPFQERVWRQDLEAVRSYLERQGFHEAEVTSREIVTDESTGNQNLTLVAVIDEGPRARIDSIQVEGADAVDSADVLEASGLSPGSPFDAAGVVEARERIVAHYYNQGFRDVNVQATTEMYEGGTSAAVAFRIGEGRRTRVDRVIISGLNATKESAVRQLVTIETGVPLSPIAILDTRQKLVGSGLFRNVDIEVLPADPLTNRSDVLISLVEGPRTAFAYGFGFEEQQLLRAEVEVTRRNLFGRNRTISVFTRASFRGGRFITTYRQPDSIFRNLPLFVSLYLEEEQRSSFSYNRAGVGLQISKRVHDSQNLFFRYRFDNTETFDLRDLLIEEVDRRFRPVRIGAVSAASVTDRRDDPLNPSSGQFRIMDIEWSATAFGTEAPYVKALAQQFFYLPLSRGLVAAMGMRVGLASGSRDILDNAGNTFTLPIAERFFAGGANTLRGFALDQASPLRNVVARDETGEPILVDGEPLVVKGDPVGGNLLSILNLELRFPIFGNLRGVVFSDNGAVYPEIGDFSFDAWRFNMGFGFRYDTPLGPLRVDYGMKLNRRTFLSTSCPDVTVPCSESFGRWHVSLGHAF